MGSNWVIDVEDCRLTITQIRRRMYTYPNAIETPITSIPLQEVVNIQPDADHRLIRVWTSENPIPPEPVQRPICYLTPRRSRQNPRTSGAL